MPRRTTVCAQVGCPNLTPCSTHGGTHTGWSPNRDRAAQHRFRTAVLQRDNYRCVGCGNTHDLRACHLTPLSEGGSYDPRNGVTRCKTCDKATDPHAR